MSKSSLIFGEMNLLFVNPAEIEDYFVFVAWQSIEGIVCSEHNYYVSSVESLAIVGEFENVVCFNIGFHYKDICIIATLHRHPIRRFPVLLYRCI